MIEIRRIITQIYTYGTDSQAKKDRKDEGKRDG
jgi:hypothetical protein